MSELIKDPRQGCLEPTITLAQSAQAGLSGSSQDWVSTAGRDHEPQSRQDHREIVMSSETAHHVSTAPSPRPAPSQV